MLKWDEKYSVGIQSIDNQHKELFRILGSLFDAMKKGQASDITTQIVLELEKYTILHFRKEEYFFQRFNYSGSIEHICEHDNFIKKVDSLKSDLKTGKATLTFELLDFLKGWINHHILVVDKMYSDCFLQNGLK
jgi:hemerythrin-like metal-binding protein